MNAAFAFRPHEETHDGFVRVLRALAAETHRKKARAPVTEAIHDLRVLIKRVRAMLWFARPVLSKAEQEKAQAQLKEAAQLLAGQRDLTVIETTLEKIGEKNGRPRDRVAVAHATQSVRRHSHAANEKTLRVALKKSTGILDATIREIIGHADASVPWPPVTQRLKKALRATHKAEGKARRTDDDDDFHAWRKKAKRLLYLAELTADESPTVSTKRVHKLQNILGDDHDCVIAARRLRAAPLPRSELRRVTKLLRQQKARLRKKARRMNL